MGEGAVGRLTLVTCPEFVRDLRRGVEWEGLDAVQGFAMMTLAEILEAIYEDLDGRIIGVNDHPDGLLVAYECSDWRLQSGRIRFRFLCRGASDWTVTVGPCTTITIAEAHPLLLGRQQPGQRVYFSSAPTDPQELSRLLEQAHDDVFGDWLPYRMHLHADAALLASGNGLLAEGPVTFIHKVLEVVRGRLKITVLPPSPAAAPRTEKWIAVLFQGQYVVCRSLELLGDSAVV